MNSAVINIKVNPKTKKEAQKIAENLGFSLSSVLNAYLKDFVRTKRVSFAMNEEEPSDWLIRELKEAEKNRKEGFVSPGFDNADDAIAWLDDPNRKYVNEL